MTRTVLLLACLPVLFAQAQTRFTVLSYNIHHAEGTDGKIDLERIARVITSVSPDVVALQEVDRRTARSGGVDQLAELSRLTGMKAYFGKTIDHQGGEYGNAILVRGTVREHCNMPLPGLEPRGFVSVRLEQPDIRFGGTHFHVGRGEDLRVQSAERINEWASQSPSTAAVFAGDLNTVRGASTLQKLGEQWRIAGDEMPTAPSDKPRRQIDFILFRPAERWKAIETRVLDEPVASDHRPILAVLELR